MSQSRTISSQVPECANFAPAGTNAYETFGNWQVTVIIFYGQCTDVVSRSKADKIISRENFNSLGKVK